LKNNESNSTKERKNITFYGNYKKNNNSEINNNLNLNKKNFYTKSDISSNNNSAIIRNVKTNTNINSNNNTNDKSTNTSNKKRKRSLLYKNPIVKEVDLLQKIRIKLKTKPVTTLQSKGNSKTNIRTNDSGNSDKKKPKQTYSTKNTNINNNIIHNTKKIFINNIINVNANNEGNIDNNCLSYRLMGSDKIQYKNQIINIPSQTPCLDNSYINKSQKHIYQNQINNNKQSIKEVIITKNKDENKLKENASNISNIYKKNILKNQNNQKIKTTKDVIKKEIYLNNNDKDLTNVYVLNSEQNNLSNIFNNMKSEVISENITIETNPSLASTLKECAYYKKECEKLSSYIKQYYEKHKYYPYTNKNFYKYGRLLGKGAFGKVNIALHLATGRLVAIKSFNKKKLTTKRAKRKIKTEIEALSKLRNPFCTQIYDYFETDTHILIVMEYVCGDLLGYIRKRAKISESTAKIIFKQIIKGLQYIHKKKIVHRDIKLDNVLIDLTNTVKICDFGVCRILQPGDVMYEHCGTPAYIAPEIFKDEGYEGFSCDIWSAGVTLYYMLAGVQPFKANKIEDLKEIIIKGEFDPVEDVSDEANDLINGMLRLDPKKRFTIEDVLKHPWLKNVNINKRENLNIFTNAEKGLLSKYDVNYLSSPKEELIEVFTISNLQTKEEKEEKGATKSDILAPYNSIALHNTTDIYHELKIENNICRFNFRAQLSNIKYELSNNQEFDNGIIKTIYNSVDEGKNKHDDEFETENTNTLNLSLDSIGTFTCGLCDDIIKDIEELIGYDKKYLVQCLRKNEINYATATYYLMLKDELNSHY
jgi:serine/threonine protein kinase